MTKKTKESAPTLGPWVYEHRVDNRGWGQMGLWGSNGSMILGSEASWDAGFIGPDDADAHLIAAAPDLLAALKKLVNHRAVPCRFTITKKSNDCYTCGKHGRLCEICTEIMEARAAIAKAEAV